MCKCLLLLVEKGFVERETVYEDEDFKEKGFQIRKYKRVKGGLFADANHVFRLNYCPACGEKIPKS
jgi:hypothetical protein